MPKRGRIFLKKIKRLTALFACAFLLASVFGCIPVAAAAGLNTTLTNLKGLNGTWREGEEGLYSEGSGDNFALSETTASDFVFEAKATFHRQSGAATLVFFAGDQPASAAYCANIDLNRKNARIFRFGFGGGDVGSRDLPEALLGKNTYTMRVEVSGSFIRYYVDGLLMVSAEEENRPSGGRLGLLTYDTGVSYQNVVHTDISGLSLGQTPHLEGLTTEGLTLKTAFSPERYSYTGKIASDRAEVKLVPAVPAGASCTVRAADSTGQSLDVRQEGEAWLIPVDGRDTDLLLSVTRGEVTLTYALRASASLNPEVVYRDTYRPQFHFSPYKNWMNDPNGLVYDPSNQTYHMFYQWNPYGLNIANQVWGHAESTDLVHWVQVEEPAIVQDDGLGAIFSGSAVVDEDNTSGFFTDNQPGESRLVALFTHDGGNTAQGYEKQSIAYSKDHGHTWIKPSLEREGFVNPVISNEGNKYGGAFRDPKVFWYDDRWVMVVAGGDARLFTSDDLIHWNFAGDLGLHSECPDLFPLAVDGNAEEIKWVYTASGRWYIVGNLQRGAVVDGVQQYVFVQETGQLPYNGGPSVYATQSYYNDGSGQGRRLLVSWLQDYSAASMEAGEKLWNGVQTVPYETTLKRVRGALRLISYPAEEVETCRTEPLLSLPDRTIDRESRNPLDGYGAQKCDIEATFTPGTATEFGFRLRQGSKQEIVVKYDTAQQKLIVDQSRSGRVNTGVYSMDLTPLDDGRVKLRVLLDTTVLEAFGNGGEATVSVLYFPEPDGVGMELFTNGSLQIDELQVYGMRSIWYDDAAKEGLRLSDSELHIITGETGTVKAVVLPTPGDEAPVWEVSPAGVVELTGEGYTASLRAVRVGTATLTARMESTGQTASTQITVTGDPFYTNLSGWNYVSGSWYKDMSGLSTDGGGGADVFALSSQRAEAIQSYTAQVAAKGCPALVFGVTNPDAPKSGTWFGANVDTFGSAVVAKLFQNTNGAEVWSVRKEIPSANAYLLKVTVAQDKTVSYWVNDTLIGSRQAEAYTGGYLGLLTWNGAGSFNRVYYLAEGEADTIALHERYTEASGYTPIAYTAASWSALEAALSDAAAVLENPAASQRQADQALAALEAAILGLRAAPRGDIDRDGSVTVSDVVDLRRRIVAGATDSDDRLLCDLDKDGGVTVSDVVELRRRIVAGQTE